MTLEEFAISAGVIVERCDPEWGGTWAYRTKDHSDCLTCGFKTKKAVYEDWLKDTFGEHCSKAVLNLLGEKNEFK